MVRIPVVLTRFNKAGASMQRDNEAGDALEDVHRIHPVVDRLRDLVTSLTALDLKATTKGYWSERGDEGDRPSKSS
jgi:hypothetical protein